MNSITVGTSYKESSTNYIGSLKYHTWTISYLDPEDDVTKVRKVKVSDDVDSLSQKVIQPTCYDNSIWHIVGDVTL